MWLLIESVLIFIAGVFILTRGLKTYGLKIALVFFTSVAATGVATVFAGLSSYLFCIYGESKNHPVVRAAVEYINGNEEAYPAGLPFKFIFQKVFINKIAEPARLQRIKNLKEYQEYKKKWNTDIFFRDKHGCLRSEPNVEDSVYGILWSVGRACSRRYNFMFFCIGVPLLFWGISMVKKKKNRAWLKECMDSKEQKDEILSEMDRIENPEI